MIVPVEDFHEEEEYPTFTVVVARAEPSVDWETLVKEGDDWVPVGCETYHWGSNAALVNVYAEVAVVARPVEES